MICHQSAHHKSFSQMSFGGWWGSVANVLEIRWFWIRHRHNFKIILSMFSWRFWWHVFALWFWMSHNSKGASNSFQLLIGPDWIGARMCRWWIFDLLGGFPLDHHRFHRDQTCEVNDFHTLEVQKWNRCPNLFRIHERFLKQKWFKKSTYYIQKWISDSVPQKIMI